MPSIKYKITKEEMVELYINQNYSYQKISDITGIPKKNLNYILHKHDIPLRDRHQWNINDITGLRSWSLVAIDTKPEYNPNRRISKYNYWKCECDCGKICYKTSTEIKTGYAKSCGCMINRKGNLSSGWKGCGEISSQRFCGLQWNAKTRDIKFQVTIQEIWNLFLQQGGKCKLSGLEIHFGDGTKPHHKKATASLDRIDSNGHYTLDNIQWVHKDVNMMKQTKNNEDFINLCNMISNNNS